LQRRKSNTTRFVICQKILLDKISIPGIKTYEVYRKNGGYASVESYESNDSDEVVEQVKGIWTSVVVVLVSYRIGLY
jgi:NADH-quinone oxidoreductase subunit F